MARYEPCVNDTKHKFWIKDIPVWWNDKDHVRHDMNLSFWSEAIKTLTKQPITVSEGCAPHREYEYFLSVEGFKHRFHISEDTYNDFQYALTAR